MARAPFSGGFVRMAMAKKPSKAPAKGRSKKVSPVVRQLPATPTAMAFTSSRRSSNLMPDEGRFNEVLNLIEAARGRAYQAVNSELVTL